MRNTRTEKKRIPVKGLVLVLAALLALGSLVLGTVSETYLWYRTSDEVVNEFEVPYYMVAVEERFEPPDAWKPGEGVVKQVAFSNTGTMDALLRVTYAEMWRAKDGSVLSSTIELNGQQESVVQKSWTDAWPETGAAGAEWVDGKDGYFYYNKVLRAGEVTSLILTGIRLNKDTPSAYGGADYTLEFRVESVLAEIDASAMDKYPGMIEQYWGKKPTFEAGGAVRW